MPPKKLKKSDQSLQTEMLTSLQREFLAHITQENERFDNIHKNITKLMENQSEMMNTMTIIKDKVNKPVMIPVQNGKLEYKQLDEVIGEIWGYIYILREGSQLKQIYRRHKKGIRNVLIGLTVGILFWCGWTYKEIISFFR